MLPFFRKSYPPVNYNQLIQQLETGRPEEIKRLLVKSNQIEYLPLTYSMIEKMKKPEGSNRGLKLFSTQSIIRYELAIFETTWSEKDFPFLPLILDRKDGRIAGIMLAFSELMPVLTTKQQKEISALSSAWIAFALEKQMGLEAEK